jgi:hypothetical protein
VFFAKLLSTRMPETLEAPVSRFMEFLAHLDIPAVLELPRKVQRSR